ncbi:baseplate hub subunit [Synechococcus phage S-CRM01]|uniref:baseplate hub subunit n=1 Tax=Synechococcus phage S-CRM01 TaxID=1026955 RepID=UPI000209E369|nr:baseplate hub subunit [Synechococcus phage S-CRM01]AEC53010.1 baseplate hub subunit [Synechococcus phage S-CRM01]
MTLPRKIRPEYTTTLSSGEKVKFVPFTVREEKVLVLAAETKDTDEITNAIANILTNCVTHPTGIKIEELPLFDLQLLFLKCRAKSAGEKVKVRITDPKDPTYSVDHEINIDKIQLQTTKDHTALITLDENTAVKLNYPGLKYFAEGLSLEGIVNTSNAIRDCVSQIIIGEEVFNRADLSEDELDTWVSDLSSEDVSKILKFFETMPALKHKITLKNPNTKESFNVVLEGLQDFF